MSLIISYNPPEAYVSADTDGFYTIVIEGRTKGDNIPVILLIDEDGKTKTHTSNTNEMGVATFEISGSLPPGLVSHRYTITVLTEAGEEQKSSYTVSR